MFFRKRFSNESGQYSRIKRRRDDSNYGEGTSTRKTFPNFFETKNILNSMLEDSFEGNIPLQLLDPEIRFKNFLNNHQNQDLDVINLLLKIIIKGSHNKMMETTFRELLTMVINSDFAIKRLDKVISVEISADFNEELLKLLIDFLKLCFQLLPGVAYDLFFNRVHNLGAVIDSLQIKTNHIGPDIIKEFEELKEMSKASSLSIPKKGFYRKSNINDNMEPPDNFMNISIFPTSKDLIDITTKDVFLRGNISKGAYKSVNHYLDVQFRLMREDFIQPLREGINAYRNDAKKKHLNIRVLKKVYLMYAMPAGKLGIVHKMTFDKSRYKRVNWMQSKQFMYGSLLCFCTDDFQKLLFATIINRDIEDLKNGILSVKFHESSPNEHDEYTLIETTNMFESYRHVLLKLQETNENNLCMKKYLVYAEKNIALPKYLSENLDLEYFFRGKGICLGNKEVEWPSAVDLAMDESQFEAFQSALTKEMTIIQGPPGTGKTYVGLNICECLINNVQSNLPFFGPILIVCYTNHALDQFLEGVSSFTDEIVRIGSRCKSENIQKFSIINWKKKYPPEFGYHKQIILRQLFKVKEEVIDKQAAVASSKKTFVSLNKLKLVINENDLHYMNNIGLRNWLSGESSEYYRHEKEEFDSIVEWLMHMEISDNILRIVMNAKKECVEEIDNYDENENDLDNEVNYVNYQRRLDVDEEDFSKLNEEFNCAFISYYDKDEISDKWKHETTKNLFESRLKIEDKITKDEYAQIESLDFLSINERWRLYRYWKSEYIKIVNESSDDLEKNYEYLSQQLNEISFEEDRQIMEGRKVIGMTTTGAARYNKVLSLIRCKIVIVEEAAEVLESHIIGSLNPGCEHLILIGDHKQLKPNPAVYSLAKKYDLDISMFERLINNNLHYNTLLLQHRMRPEIAEIMSFIYKNLQNHESVYNYPNVPSVGSNLYFFDHQEVEVQVENIMSYSNRFEAEFIVKFCRHLMKNGVERTQITVLTFYSGQMFLLRKLMDRNIFEGVRVCVVDNYQGEENDIILLSLVRSNELENIGFLNIENRICVSLSRARHGFYAFGNFQILTNKNEKWKEICHFLKRKGKLSAMLPLFCQNHPDKKMTILKPDDFNNYPEGGCQEVCNQRLKCGHACRKSCHFLDGNHENNVCLERCTKSCPNKHRCKLKCWEQCKDCTFEIEKSIPDCNHRQIMSCGMEPLRKHCKSNCERELDCGHKCTKSCKEKCEPCLIKVTKVSPDCKHSGEYYCSDKDIVCKKSCESILGCGHTCSGTCGSCYMGRLHETCQNDCKAQLICGHVCNTKCSRNCPSCRQRCEEGCSHNGCPNKCGEDCIPCYEKCLWQCEHEVCKKLCYELCERSVCNKFCDKYVFCDKCKWKFLCYGVCGEKCRTMCFNCDPEVLDIFFGTEDEKNSMFITLWTCGHTLEVTSMDKYMEMVPDDGEIVTKKCPKCKTVINKRSCFRYLNIVKKISFDIKKIQSKMKKTEESVSEFIKKLDACSVKISKICQIYDIENYFYPNDRLMRSEVAPFRTALDLICELYERCFSDGKMISSDYIDKSVHNLIIWLNPRKRKFNEFEIDQFNVEFNRIDMLLKIHEGQHETDVPIKEVSDFINELKQIIFKPEVAKEFKQRWNDFQTKLYLPNLAITEYERKAIVKAVDVGKGRWFKCPKGHFYVIGECGGANEVSICPECKCSIGGTQHRLLADNQFAPEIDDAISPAYPGMNFLI